MTDTPSSERRPEQARSYTSNGLLTDRRQGQWVFYRLHPDLSPWVITLLQGALADHQDWLAADVARLHAMSDRPERCC